MTSVEDSRDFHLYPDPDPHKSGRIGYLCRHCGHEEICPRYGLPDTGFNLSAMTPGANPRVVWVCSLRCLRIHAASLEPVTLR